MKIRLLPYFLTWNVIYSTYKINKKKKCQQNKQGKAYPFLPLFHRKIFYNSTAIKNIFLFSDEEKILLNKGEELPKEYKDKESKKNKEKPPTPERGKPAPNLQGLHPMISFHPLRISPVLNTPQSLHGKPIT